METILSNEKCKPLLISYNEHKKENRMRLQGWEKNAAIGSLKLIDYKLPPTMITRSSTYASLSTAFLYKPGKNYNPVNTNTGKKLTSLVETIGIGGCIFPIKKEPYKNWKLTVEDGRDSEDGALEAKVEDGDLEELEADGSTTEPRKFESWSLRQRGSTNKKTFGALELEKWAKKDLGQRET